MTFKTILKISRPRFWLYLAGTYAVGFSQGGALRADYGGEFFLHLLYFLLPANILLYGINDIFDEDTDAANEKKSLREHRLLGGEKMPLAAAVAVCALLGIALAFSQSFTGAQYALFAFLFLAMAYSTPPLRFKAKPFIDFASNILYIMPGIVGYVQVAHRMPPAAPLCGAFLWAMGMHLFSAIPDIAADAKAGLKTSAVMLGREGSLLLCAALWGGCAALLLSTGTLGLLSWGALLYPAMALAPLAAKVHEGTLYWYFPLVNAACGFFLFWESAWKLLLL